MLVRGPMHSTQAHVHLASSCARTTPPFAIQGKTDQSAVFVELSGGDADLQLGVFESVQGLAGGAVPFRSLSTSGPHLQVPLRRFLPPAVIRP